MSHFPYNKAQFLAEVARVEHLLDEIVEAFLDDHFDYCSELRAHKEFLRHYRQYLEQTESTPFFRNTHLSWLLNFQIDRALASWLCDQLTPSPEGHEPTGGDSDQEDADRQLARERERFLAIWHQAQSSQQGGTDRRWKLPHIEYVEAEDSQDYLETAFGKHDMRACIIRFRPVQTHLVSLADVAEGTQERAPDEIEMALKIYAYGICTVEFSIENLELDVFRLRQISALIAPFAHKSAFTWVEGHHQSEASHTTHRDASQLEPLAEHIFHGLKTTLASYLTASIEVILTEFPGGDKLGRVSPKGGSHAERTTHIYEGIQIGSGAVGAAEWEVASTGGP
ncbi:MAG TPA: hypothetical protein VKT82_30880 [Ktedonobacterales bacterium]|nr:hypothetical protein [Ktedonobacterales bacterium]